MNESAYLVNRIGIVAKLPNDLKYYQNRLMELGYRDQRKGNISARYSYATTQDRMNANKSTLLVNAVGGRIESGTKWDKIYNSDSGCYCWNILAESINDSDHNFTGNFEFKLTDLENDDN